MARIITASATLLVLMLCAQVEAGAAMPGQAPASEATGATPTLCEQPVPAPARLPPADSGPVVYLLGLCFSAQGNVSLVDPATYLYYVKLRPSRPSQDEWVPYDQESRATMKQDFDRLWATNFLDDLKIEVLDYVFANGVVGKLVTYHLEERQRVKIVSYDGSERLDRSKLEEHLRTAKSEIRLDSFLDARMLRTVETAIREQLAEKGFTDSVVTHTLTPVGDGPKLVNVTFHIVDGAKLMIRDLEFIGNRAISDGALQSVVKHNRAQGLLSPVSGKGAYQQLQFAEDAQRLEDYYRDHGYVDARVGEPQLRPLYRSSDGRTQFIQLRIPVTEGPQYRVGAFDFDGNTVVKSEALRGLFKLKPGDVYRQQSIREGLDKAREIYGAGGYMEFTGYPDLKHDETALLAAGPSPPVALADAKAHPDVNAPPVVDVTVRLSEGSQFFVNRISINGNVTTRDHVVRRELQLLEGGVFNTEALKSSVRRLNQLGYFKPLEGSDKDVKVEKATDRERAVDVSLQLQEQNRNQMTFGAGVSQYDGLFGNLSFTTTNFLGRGESVTISAQKGSRASNYQLSFNEPALFESPLSAGLSVFSSKVDYLTTGNVVGYSQVREGINLTLGRRVSRFSRLFLTYAYEIIDTAASDSFTTSTAAATASGYYGLAETGRNTESRVSPSFEQNTVDSPFKPRNGYKVTASLPVAGGVLGGTSNYVRPEIDTVLYIPTTRRTAIGLRMNVAMIQPFGETSKLPYYLRFFLGGEYQIRGVNLRTVGPADSQNRAIGGNKSLLFNAEYYLDFFGPVRLLLFHDAGQAYAEGHPIDLRELRTSSGVEARFMMPVLNVPFRLIYSWNIYRDTFQPPHGFKFAVGTTF